jgi:hypothetical protein
VCPSRTVSSCAPGWLYRSVGEGRVGRPPEPAAQGLCGCLRPDLAPRARLRPRELVGGEDQRTRPLRPGKPSARPEIGTSANRVGFPAHGHLAGPLLQGLSDALGVPRRPLGGPLVPVARTGWAARRPRRVVSAWADTPRRKRMTPGKPGVMSWASFSSVPAAGGAMPAQMRPRRTRSTSSMSGSRRGIPRTASVHLASHRGVHRSRAPHTGSRDPRRVPAPAA